MVRREIRFIGTIQSVLNYARTFRERYAVSFVNAHVLDIVENMMSSKFLAENSKATYAWYIHAAKMMIKNNGALPLLVSLSVNVTVVKPMGIIHFDDACLYILTKKENFLMI